MKNSKIMLSVIMVFVIILISVVPAFATDTKRTSPVVIKEDLATVMENSDANDKIKVYIWYKDIDQNEVDVLTTKATGLTPESCAVITEFPSAELLTSLEKGEVSAQKQMDNYMERTKADRKKERENTDNYAKKHMEIATAKYNTKSENVRESISLSDNDTVFSSELAPLIIAEMTKQEIEDAVDNPNIEEINLYYEMINEEPGEDLKYLDNGEYAKDSIGLSSVYDIHGLTGNGVDVGLIEANVPGPWIDSSVDFGIDYDEITVIENPNYPISPSKTTVDDKHFHSNNSYRVMAHSDYGIAPNINKYATNCVLENIEAMLKYSTNGTNPIDIIEYNNSTFVFERGRYPYDNENSDNGVNLSYAYVDLEKYIDHIVSAHSISVVVAGGNYGANLNDYFDKRINPETNSVYGWRPGARLTSPGLAYNAITVGAYDNNNDEERNDSNDILCYYSSWKNSYNGLYGCAKPDVIMPANFYHGGTSESSPALTAAIALMLELKPSLSLHPEAVKAIVLASCHRKVKMPNESETAETMQGGITEKQGAGAPDAWTMASIICQGSYGIGVLNGSSTKINFVQPPYGASNMNVSVAWIRENTHANTSNPECGDINDVVSAPSYNLDLQVVPCVGNAKSSTLTCSSTEMCYLPLSSTDFRYQIRLTNNTSSTASVRYGYAWSTDNMRAAPLSDEGVYYIKNVDSGKYITYTETSGTPQVTLSEISETSTDNSVYQWVVEGLNFIPGCETEKLYLAQGSTAVGTSRLATLDDEEEEWYPLHNDDGTVSYVNVSYKRILSHNGDNVVWDSFSITSTPTSAQKWNLEKNNYIVADANADGAFSSAEATVNVDARFIQQCLLGTVTPTNVQSFLSDANRDGVIDIFDATWVLAICDGDVIY